MQMLRHIFGVWWHTRSELNFWCILACWFMSHVGCCTRFASVCHEQTQAFILCIFIHCLTPLLFPFCFLASWPFFASIASDLRHCCLLCSFCQEHGQDWWPWPVASSVPLLHSFAVTVSSRCCLPDLQAPVGIPVCYFIPSPCHLLLSAIAYSLAQIVLLSIDGIQCETL